MIKNHKRKSNKVPHFVALSFFTGLGGLDIGLAKAGIRPVLVDDIDSIARKSIAHNYPDLGLAGNVANLNKRQIFKLANLPFNTHVDCIFGGPPCQSFSTIGKRRGLNDTRGNALLQYLRIISEIRPTYVILENVRGLLSAKITIKTSNRTTVIKGGVLNHILNVLHKNGYSVSFNLYDSANFGASEKRERLVLIGKLGSHTVNYLKPTNSNDPRFNLPKWNSLENAIKGLNPHQHYIHYPANHQKYIKYIPEGSNWRSLPVSLQKKYMKKAYYSSGGRSGYLRRLDLKKPSPTLVTSPIMKATDLIHPVLNRPLSVEEYMRIQGFPDNWYIAGSLSDQYKQIGNAVPISLGYAIGRCIQDDIHNRTYYINPDFKFSRYHHTNNKTWHPTIRIES